MPFELGRIARVPANGIIRFNCNKPSPLEGKWPGMGWRSDQLNIHEEAELGRLNRLEQMGAGQRNLMGGREREIVHPQTPGYSKTQLDYLSVRHPKDVKRNAQFDGRLYYYANVGSNTLKVMIFKAKKYETIVSSLAQYDNYSIYPTNEMKEVSNAFTSLHILYGKWARPGSSKKSLHEQMAGPIVSNGLISAITDKFAGRDVIYVTHETKAKKLEKSGYTRLGKWDGGTLSQLSFFLSNHKHLTKSSRIERGRDGVDKVIAMADFALNIVSSLR